MTGQNPLITTLQELNYRRTASALSLWKGEHPAIEPYRLYENYEDFLKLQTLEKIDRVSNSSARTRLKHAFIDHYLQQILMPHETEMQTWMRGGVAIINDQRVYFKDIIHWCQQSSTHADRKELQKETGPLCKFFKPFALNYWSILLDLIQGQLDYSSYIDYCSEKKGIDYGQYFTFFQDLLRKTDTLYFQAMQVWTKRQFKLPLDSLNRFDAINLLGLGEFDTMLPRDALDRSKQFFNIWKIDLTKVKGLFLDIQRTDKKSTQAMSFLLRVPGEIHIVINPSGGWVDLETLWHELGHGLSAAFTSPRLSIVDRELSTSFSLSESFAFLLQNASMSTLFLHRHLQLSLDQARELHRYKMLKDLAVFRRYAAKFIAEYRMFDDGSLSDGNPYAELMARHTGFYHQPESHLFDLVPEFYCLDYLLGWMGEAVMETHLHNSFGANWIFQPAAGDMLKQWWHQGNQFDIAGFFKRNRLGTLSADLLVKRWKETLSDFA
ncbi:MAG: hypothetical protein JRF32_00095 [Deltaproteobacteria bacterium]|nr:hypothetical protein [Deltaproteobacteria bacterium]